MFFDLKDRFFNFITDRTVLLYVVILLLSAVLFNKIFELQIVDGQMYLDNFTLSIEKELDIPASRGCIYDRNGVLLAYNDLAYSVTITDTIESGKHKNETLNNIIFNMNNIIKSHGDDIECDFGIYLDENDNYMFSQEGTAQLRFLADVYGHTSTSDLKYAEKTANPDEVIAYLGGEKKYGVGGYLEGEKGDVFAYAMGYTKEDVLDIVRVRYNLSLNGYQKYIATTVSTQINERTAAAIMENSDILDGVKIEEQSIRKYNDAVYFAPFMGYVGKISPAEYAEYSAINPNYSTIDVVGKTGIEYSMESNLQGTKGKETVFVDNLGRIKEVTDVVLPTAGNDVYLTIDANLQKAMYDLLEQKIAGIIVAKLKNVKEVDEEGRNPSIPIYDVYYACFNNNLIDVNRLTQPYASDVEQTVGNAIALKKDAVIASLEDELRNGNRPYNTLSKEYQVYESFIVNMLASYNYGLIMNDKIDTTDETYINWKINETIGVREYLNYAIAMQWIDISKLDILDEYADSSEIYDALVDYIINKLRTNGEFTKKVIKYMILSDSISPRSICQILWEQDVIQIDSDYVTRLKNGAISSYDFMEYLIENLKLTPAQLGLEPCSGSMVITDCNTGEVLALVSYPGYDNNRLANTADTAYLAALNADLSKPLWNYATQQKTAPGSIFKMVSSTAGVMEGVINTDTLITCTGTFEKLNGTIHKCHVYPGSHGQLSVSNAIRHSCNCFFYEVGYRLAYDGTGYSDTYGIERLAKYADLYGLSEKSGVEIAESEPQVSNQYPVPSAIGQGTNSYTTVGLARYTTAIANGGTVFNLSLINRVVDTNDNALYEYTPNIRNTIDIPDNLWNAIHVGMRGVVQNKYYFNSIAIETAGKTGTAQEATNKANHALFVGYAPYQNPTMTVAIRIANGYTSDYAAQVALDVYKYYFNLADEQDILTGTASQVTGTIGGD